MEFLVGDLQLVSNHAVLHARSAYTDSDETSRHLLRLWLSLDEPSDRTWLHVLDRISWMEMVGQFLWGKLRSQIW